MKKLKLMMIFGTRPEAIKMAPLIYEFKKHPSSFDVKVCITAQHREMLDQVLSLFEIIPEYDLNLMKPNQELPSLSGAILNGLNSILKDESPDWVFVHGDTTTTFMATLSAFYQKIPVAHIEAGLRTHNLHSPWPEEMNRRLTGVLAELHFAPTVMAKKNLLNEGVLEKNIILTGNTVIDALLLTLQKLREDSSYTQTILKLIPNKSNQLKRILVTMHRRENFGESVLDIVSALKKLAQRDDVEIVFPVHRNPAISVPVHKELGGYKNILLIEPLDYAPFVYLMSTSYLILTDSGGVQEEAPSLGIPVLVMRNESERMEAVHAGCVKLVGTSEQILYKECMDLLDSRELYNKMSQVANPYGDGEASVRIVHYYRQNYCQSISTQSEISMTASSV